MLKITYSIATSIATHKMQYMYLSGLLDSFTK